MAAASYIRFDHESGRVRIGWPIRAVGTEAETQAEIVIRPPTLDELRSYVSEMREISRGVAARKTNDDDTIVDVMMNNLTDATRLKDLLLMLAEPTATRYDDSMLPAWFGNQQLYVRILNFWTEAPFDGEQPSAGADPAPVPVLRPVNA